MTAKDLKNALLQEAVQGKLVPQIASEGNARDLLEEIRKEKAKLVKEGKIKKDTTKASASGRALPEITEEEIPFEIPENWCWCRIKDIAYVSTGMTPLKSESKFYENGNIPWVTSTLTSSDYIDKADTYITEFALNNTSLDLYPVHTLILAMYGQGKTRGQISELLIPATINQACAAIELFSNEETLRKYMKLFHNWNYNNLRKEAAGSAQPNLNLNIIQNTIFPLPPLAEQKRIVAAIEKFMPLIEEYGKKETELKAFNEQIGTLTKKAILQEAVQGKLVPQIAAEGNAKDLLEEINKEKTKLIKEGKIKKEKPLPEISDDEIPFDIPENWCWCRLGEIVYNNGQKTPDKEFSYIDIGSIDNEHQKLNEKENFIQPENAPSRARKIVKKGDIIYSTVRPYLHNMCIIDKDFEKEPIASTGFAVLACYPQISNQYLFYYLLSPSFDNYANDTENSKGVAYPAINDDRLYKGIVPLPPLEEQKRIVAAIEKLLSLCEKFGE